jgi:hypothetical protein
VGRGYIRSQGATPRSLSVNRHFSRQQRQAIQRVWAFLAARFHSRSSCGGRRGSGIPGRRDGQGLARHWTNGQNSHLRTKGFFRKFITALQIRKLSSYARPLDQVKGVRTRPGPSPFTSGTIKTGRRVPESGAGFSVCLHGSAMKSCTTRTLTAAKERDVPSARRLHDEPVRDPAGVAPAIPDKEECPSADECTLLDKSGWPRRALWPSSARGCVRGVVAGRE